ncbi:MAG: hypothetical protein GY802_15405, partial [Gammaproteobacteria bacterium]|nr:hypothetical protein [Gammaproteobacteria bacterium]
MSKKSKKLVMSLFATGIAIGILFWNGLHSAAEQTNRFEFCVSCHEMGQVYEEYKKAPTIKMPPAC